MTFRFVFVEYFTYDNVVYADYAIMHKGDVVGLLSNNGETINIKSDQSVVTNNTEQVRKDFLVAVATGHVQAGVGH